MKSFQMELVNGLKKDFNITVDTYDKSIAALIKKYIKGQITKNNLLNILSGFAKQKES